MKTRKIKISKFISCITGLVISVFFSLANNTNTSLSAAYSTLLQNNNSSNETTQVEKVRYASSSNPTLTISSTYTNDGCYTPNTSGDIYISLTLSEACDHDVKIYFHATDGTAVSEAGDYYFTNGSVDSSNTNYDKAKETHKQSLVTIVAGKTGAGINYSTSKSDIITNLNNTINRDYFYFVIDDVVGANITTTSYKCGLNYKKCLTLWDYNGQKMFSDYWVSGYESFSFEAASDTPLNRTGSLLPSISGSQAYSDLVSTGLANIYASFYMSVSGFLNVNAAGATLTVGDSKLLGWYEDWFRKSSKTAYVENAFSDRKCGDYAMIEATEGYTYNFYAYNDSDWNRDYEVSITTKIWDRTAPEIIGYYIDASEVKRSNKVILSVRFSEPVQVNETNKPSMESSITVGVDTTEFKFDYVGGSYSDTLIFETSMTSIELAANNSVISTFNFTRMNNLGSIGDFGCNNDNVNNYLSNSNATSAISGNYANITNSAKCDIDLRVPEVSITSSNTTSITKTRTINVTVNRMAAGTVYYAWRKEGSLVLDNASDYDGYQTIVRDGYSYHDFSITGSGFTGEYYLYILSISEFGIQSTAKFGRSKADGTIIGGYLFDNTNPTIDGSSIVKDDLTAKVFELDVTDGTNLYDSGINSIYINVAKNKDINKATQECIYTAKNNQIGLTRYGYELNSSCLYLTYYVDDDENESIIATSLDGYVFSSKEAAIDYVTLCEYYDLTIEKKYADETFTLCQDESKPSGDYAYYIKYKASDFNYDSYSIGTNDVKNTIGHEEYIYYLYEGTDLTKLDISLLSDNLKSAIYANACKVVEKGNIVDLLNNNYLTEDYTGIISSKKSFIKPVDLSTVTYLSNSLIQDEYIYKDSGFKMNSDGGDYLYCLTAEDLGLGENKYAYYTIWFTVVDNVGNVSVIPNSKSYVKYDTRTLFTTTKEVTLDGKVISSIDSNVEAYDMDKGSSLEMTFSTILTADDTGVIGINNVYYQNTETPLEESEYSKYFSASSAEMLSNAKDSKMTISFIEPGYYRFEFVLNNGVNPDPTKLKTSVEYEFYITSSMDEQTINYLGSTNANVLTNQVYQLTTSYTYLDSNNAIKKISYNYVYKEQNPEIKLSSDLLATFSSKSVASEYVRYKEEQDFYLLILNSSTAENLNNGANKDFIKADGEVRTAYAGQAWIRYKRRTWNVDSSEYDWVYYYYGESGTTSISVSNISDNLKLALDDVVTYITNLGKQVNLVGEGYLDDNGAPTLDNTQKHYASETKEYTYSGSLCIPSLEYSGDKELYQNNVSYSDSDSTSLLALCSNCSLHSEDLNSVYYAYYNGSVDESALEFTLMEFSDGQTYRNVIDGGTGVYYIREFGKEGINQYKIYIDNSAPCLQVSYRSATDNVAHNPVFDSAANNQTYSAKTFTIGAIDSVQEKDTLSYVAVYNKNNMKLLNTYFYNYLLTNYVELETGEYYILVSDRSGNSYHFNVYVNSTELEVEAVIVDNDCVQVSINRTKDQIYLYEVYLNGNSQPIDKTWEGTKKKYRENGTYRIVVRDIYGFTVEIGGDASCSFERDLPKLTWSYLGDDGNYYKYEDGVTTCMQLTQSLGTTTYINTSKAIRFTMDGEYEYSFEGLEKGDYTESFLSNVVTITSTKDFEMSIWYTDYPNIIAHYVCRMDTMAPEITLTYKNSSWSLDEDDYIAQYEVDANIGDVYTPTTIGYSLDSEVTTAISEGSIVNSNLIKLNLYDASGVASLQVYLDDVLFKDYPEGVDDSTIVTLSRYGTYKIIAVDVFGNKRTFEFTNTLHESSSFSIDGEEKELREEDTLYGHDNATISINDDGLLAIKVTNSENKSFVNLYNIENGQVKIAEYVCEAANLQTGEFRGIHLVDKTYKGINNLGEQIDLTYILLDTNDVSFSVNRWYQILSIEENAGYNLYVMYDRNKNILFKVEVQDEKSCVEFRSSFDDVEPYYYKTYLSTEITDATLLNTNGEAIETIKNGITYTNNSFTFDENISEDIISINISYSNTRDFKDFIDVYPTTITVDDKEKVGLTQFDTSNNGFYQINVTNIYGNVATYTINRSDVFVVITEATYEDGNYNRYDETYDDIIKSNKSILLEAYAANASFEVYKDGTLYEMASTKEDGYYSLTFILEGTYQVKCIDNNYGNIVDKTLIIKHSKLTYNDDLLIGYNKKALINEDTIYSNYKLSIDELKVDKYNLKYVSITFDGNENILLDLNNQEKVDNLDDYVSDCIGSLGNGIYTITIKDEYGTYATRVIDYKEDTTISLSRLIRTASEEEIYTVDYAMENGIYSNSSINFETVATHYTFKVDGEENQLPYQLALLFQSGSATIPHLVYYKDEYGNEYEFDAILERKELSLTLNESIITKEIDNVLTTRNNVSLDFSEGSCTYTLDGSEPIAYEANQVLKKDGYYRFTLQDRAGNITTQAIKKDTYVDYTFEDSSTGNTIINKQVVNNGPVEFNPNSKDNVSIEYLYIDGVKQTKIDKKFSTQGHYVLLLTDKIGNESLFEFYLIKYEISEFNYTTPTTYKITDAWYSIGDGNFVNYMNSGAIEQFDNYSTINLTENGIYQITMTSEIYSNGVSFGIEIDNTAPVVSLVGCNEGEKTIEDITIEGYEAGDTIYIYKDGELISTTEVTSTLTDSPVISEGGKYEVVITNRAGVSTTLKFERKRITNNSGSALIIIACLAISIGVLIGVVMRNKQKFDE